MILETCKKILKVLNYKEGLAAANPFSFCFLMVQLIGFSW